MRKKNKGKKVEDIKIPEPSNISSPKQLLVLNGLNLKIKKREFVCIIGDIGSGKSSLLSSIIGDMLHIEEA